jgi:hypothetical protein
MKLFISWSGSTSHKVAMLLRDWMPSVIQALEPYVSSEDIDKGARWSTDISKELEQASYGLLCVTRDNLEAPWLNFEAGALSKSFDKSRVSPFLFGVKRSEVKGPLLQFQSTVSEKEDVRKLLQSLNKACTPPLLDERRLQQIFDVWWPTLETQLRQLASEEVASATSEKPVKASEKARESAAILEEILDLVRTQQKILRTPEVLLPPEYLRATTGGASADWHHPVFTELAISWRSVRDALKLLSPSESEPVQELVKAISRLSDPLTYIEQRASGRRILRYQRPRAEAIGDVNDAK